MKFKFKLLDVIMFLILIISIFIFLYPFVQNQLNNFIDQKIITHYQNNANEQNEKERNTIIKKQEAENKKLAKEKNAPGLTSFNQAIDSQEVTKKKTIDYYQQHTIGVLYIPSINVELPIFDKTNDSLLQRGASLLEGSSYPSDDQNVHSIISAHRGLPSAKLFTDLPKMKIGDTFFIDINKKKLAYEVIDINVVTPTDTDSLSIKEGENLVTLLTCTPYMINTHRLLVTGKHVPYDSTKNKKAIQQISKSKKIEFLLLVLMLLVFSIVIFFIIYTVVKRIIISSRNYSLSLQFFNRENKPLKKQKVTLIPISKKKSPIHLELTDEGKLNEKSIPGGTYSLCFVNGTYKHAQDLTLKVEKIKDTYFSLSVKNKKQPFSISFIKSHHKYQVFYKRRKKRD